MSNVLPLTIATPLASYRIEKPRNTENRNTNRQKKIFNVPPKGVGHSHYFFRSLFGNLFLVFGHFLVTFFSFSVTFLPILFCGTVIYARGPLAYRKGLDQNIQSTIDRSECSAPKAAIKTFQSAGLVGWLSCKGSGRALAATALRLLSECCRACAGERGPSQGYLILCLSVLSCPVLSGPVSRDTARLSQRYPLLRAMGFLVSQHGQ